MANRRTSWRRASANTQPHHRRPQKNQTTLPFSGVEDHAVLTVFAHLLAKNVNVNVVNGALYTGLFVGTQHSPNSNDLLLILRYARLVRGKPIPTATVHDPRGNTAARIHIPVSRITTVLGAPIEHQKRAFATDSQISRGSTGVGRQLQRFEDFTNVQTPNSTANNPAPLDQQTFGSLTHNTPRDKWDQFQVNQAKFGVTTSFDESEYTTTIDRSSKDFAQRQREADRLAEEIESAPSQNIHVREERNQEVATDYDEEARYSGVQRPQTTTPQPRAQVPVKDPAPERPRLSYAAAAAGGANAESRQHLSSKPPSAGATHIPSSTNKVAPSQVKNTGTTSKPSSTPSSKHQQQGGKASQDQNAKHSHAASRTSHSISVKSAPPNGKISTQTSKAANKKGPVATSKQQQQAKSGGGSGKSSNPSQGNKSASHSTSSRPSTQSVNPKSYPAAHAKTPASSAKTTTPTQSATTSQEAAQTKPTTSKAITSTSAGSKDKPAEEKQKPTGRERPSRDSLPQVVKVRATLTGRTSPNQSRNSPLPTPAVADTSAIGVLNLDAQTPNLGPEQIKRFEEYKTNREFQSIAKNREKITDDLKKFSTQLDSRERSLRRSQNSSNSSIGGSSGPGTPRASAKAMKSMPEVTIPEKVIEDGTKKDASVIKEENQKDRHAEIESTEGKESVAKPIEKAEEATTKPRSKSKSKLNPNAQEFKLNPDAPSFTPASQKVQTQNSTPYTPYTQAGSPVEYQQQVPVPQGYALPIQGMSPMPYAQPYVVVPTVPTPVAGGSGSGYPFVQQAPSFGPAHVAGRFPQSAGVSVSYGYPQVTPMVIAQPPPQRVPTSPYYHNSGPYSGGQAPPGHITPPHQTHLYQQGAPTHLPGGGLSMAGRGGHGNPRRGGTNRSRGKTSLQQSYPHVPSATGGDKSAPKSPDGARSPGGLQR